jgi:hypothetical protein
MSLAVEYLVRLAFCCVAAVTIIYVGGQNNDDE